MIPGVGQREVLPPALLDSHQQQTGAPPFHTTESCWDTESRGRDGRACPRKNKLGALDKLSLGLHVCHQFPECVFMVINLYQTRWVDFQQRPGLFERA